MSGGCVPGNPAPGGCPDALNPWSVAKVLTWEDVTCVLWGVKRWVSEAVLATVPVVWLLTNEEDTNVSWVVKRWVSNVVLAAVPAVLLLTNGEVNVSWVVKRWVSEDVPVPNFTVEFFTSDDITGPSWEPELCEINDALVPVTVPGLSISVGITSVRCVARL
jgi:hypothetical protein